MRDYTHEDYTKAYSMREELKDYSAPSYGLCPVKLALVLSKIEDRLDKIESNLSLFFFD